MRRRIIAYVFCGAAVLAFNAVWKLVGLDTGGLANSAWWNGMLTLVVVQSVLYAREGRS